MKTQNTKLAFKKNSLVELTESQLLEVDGGTSPPCAATAFYALGAAAVGAIIGYTLA